MLPYIFTLLSVCSASALLANNEPVQRCSQQEPTAEFLEFSKELSSPNYTLSEFYTDSVIEVDTYFHILATSESEKDGYLSVRPDELRLLAQR